MSSAQTASKTPFYFGGASSCVAATVLHPLDLTKVRLQNMTANAARGQNMVTTMLSIARNEGALRLYTGLSASILRQSTYSTVRFGAYEKLKQGLIASSDDPSKKPKVWELLICSSTAGALGGLFGNPGDVVNVRMQNDGQLALHERRNYKHALDGIIRISREEGIKTLFRGMGPNMSRAILVTCSQCVSYDTFKDIILRYTPMSEGLPLHLTASVLAGLVATTVCSPADVVKTRVMSANGAAAQHVSSLKVMSGMYKAEGIRSFFKGWTPAFVRLGPQTIITFVVFEQLKKWHSAWQTEKSLISTTL
ncbi:mitochondrial carrier domain-containing protein [Dichotomocladium elegans]|nr:mitochondrial carrier domain-containing protein [Dichotomocladium elegans]